MQVIGNSIESKRIAEKIGAEHIEFDEKRYPDTEISARFTGEVASGEKLLYYRITNTHDVDTQLFNLLCFLHEIDDRENVTLVFPYFPYLRSIPLRKEYEVNKLKHLMAELKGLVKKILAVGLHDAGSALAGLEAPEVVEVDTDQVLLDFVKKEGTVLVSPDAGFEPYVKRVAEKGGLSYTAFRKRRLSPTEVVIETDADVIKANKEKRFMIIDDIVSTGGTMKAAIKQLKEHGAVNVSCFCFHNLFSTKQLEGAPLYCANTVSKESAVDVTEAVIAAVNGK